MSYLSDVREAYEDLLVRAAIANPGYAEYVMNLGNIWKAKLAEIDDASFDERGTDGLIWMLQAIRDDNLTPDDLLEWIDVFPDGMIRAYGYWA